MNSPVCDQFTDHGMSLNLADQMPCLLGEAAGSILSNSMPDPPVVHFRQARESCQPSALGSPVPAVAESQYH
jgi:hypothetical protein